jgi:aryl-alcohol dehydrogenase-like predicted oxidoreductase
MIARRPLGRTGLHVSEIGFGALEIGRDWAADVNEDPSHPDPAEAARVLNGILDLGINFIDTAPAYWHSEEFIGQALAHRRAEFILATKVGEHCDRSGSVYDYSHEATLRFIDNSLRKLHTDRIDLLQIHSASLEVLERGETWAAMDEARRAGKVLHLGMTGGVKECLRAVELGGYETIQVPYNLLALEAEEKLLPLAREKGIGVIIMRGLAGGKLSAKFERLADERLKSSIRALLPFVGEGKPAADLPQLAIGYVLAHPAVSTVIAGSRRLEHVRHNRIASERPLPSDYVHQVAAQARSLAARTW